MFKLLISLIINGAAVAVAAYLVPGVTISSFVVALAVALVLGLLNITLKPVLKLISFPVNLATLGLFSIVINTLLIVLVDQFITGFAIDNIITAVIFSVVLSITNGILNWFK